MSVVSMGSMSYEGLEEVGGGWMMGEISLLVHLRLLDHEIGTEHR